MCTRVTLATGRETLAKAFPGVKMPADIPPRYNIAPTDVLYAVIALPDGSRELAGLVWGLVPHWAKDREIGRKLMNARAETVHEKPSFRGAFRERRCLVVVDGFYEWRPSPDGRSRIPYRFTVGGGEPFALAGLWDEWRGEGEETRTCAVITTTSNTLVGAIHDRMPVIIPPERYDEWLDPAMHDTGRLREMLKPYPDGLMDSARVSARVNNPRNDGPDLIVPA